MATATASHNPYNSLPSTLLRALIIFVFVFLSGFANLATQIIGPRMFASFLGADTVVWAVMISVTLVGLSVGYYWGGRIPLAQAKRYLPLILVANAAYLFVVSIVVWLIPAEFGNLGTLSIILITFAVFFIPSTLFGTVSPISITLFSELVQRKHMSRVTGSIYGVGTIGNVIGAVAAAFVLIPYVGLTLSLELFAAGMLPFALYFWLSARGQRADTTTATISSSPDDKLTENLKLDYRAVILLVLVFFSGFASLATEIIAPRMFTSIYGPTTILWAIMISITLFGLSIGYFIGGNIPLRFARVTLPTVITANAILLLLASWIVWELPAMGQLDILGLTLELNAGSVDTVILTALFAFLLPSILFGIDSQIVIALLAQGKTKQTVSRIVGIVFSVTTIGSFLGAVAAAIVLLPTIGFSTSLQAFALIFMLFALYLYPGYWRVLALGALVFFVVFPQPDWRWSEENLTLLAQREGYYQTIRVYTDEQSFIRLHLGPTYESEMDINTLQPRFGYARNMVESAGTNLAGKHVLVIGGAGHSIARALEARGATTTEVEIDPIVVQLSDEFFGEIAGDVVVQDGRAFVEQAPDETYDIVMIDAFNGPQSIPAQLTTLEFFESVERILKPEGAMVMNFIGYMRGERAGSYVAMSATIAEAFPVARQFGSAGNILFIASKADLPQYSDLPTVEDDGQILTDDLNPIELLLEEARGQGLRYRR